MGKWIDADALKEYIGSVRAEFDFFDDDERARYEAHSKAIYLLDLYISDAPSIDIEPKRGEWIESGFEEIKCSVCGSAWDYCDNDCERFNFCPSCGADMREVRDE